MNYVRLENDGVTVKKYPFELFDLPQRFPDVSFVQPFELNDLAAYNVFPVTPVTPPVYNNSSHTLEEGVPALVSDVWTQQWVVTPLSAPDATQALQRERKERWRQVKALRDDKIRNGGIFTNNQWYPSSAEAKAEMLWVKVIGANTGQRIELLDGSMANLTFNRVNDLLTAGAAQAAALADYADSLKVLIDASANPATVDITTGWPATYVPA